MEDTDVCPLCCEELDISDRQFFPCKCGYQVCMWCWHRIRESESGLCPACRTPYGDDPHEFSAVDMAEVLKANKEKAAAEKRERERLRQASSGDDGLGGLHSRSASDGDISSGGLGRGGPMDLPRDRNQLANMRVIRRNLVYAVGLPPSIASEDTLRKPEYFGQYGKISKIVLNRNTTGSGDPRRASASAYVTFAHKEDTLACILALDGFYIDGRNIRASYGTSKYCSAFIKNVRCNNPECTYLHCMGEAEDTFTKQEIQAGYVTSGRDVLARQQQIVAQALSAAAGGNGSGSGTRRKVGGGGPSGTGRACANPQFPPPCYDEPQKSSSSGLVSSSASMNRSNSAGSGFPSVAAAGPASSSADKFSRSASLGASPALPVVPAPKGAIGSVGMPGSAPVPTGRKTAIGATGSGLHAVGGSTGTVIGGGTGATAASVVAGVRSSSSAAAEPPAPHTTLTPLTPLKRASTLAAPVKSSSSGVSGVKQSNSVDNGIDSVQLPPNMPVPKGLTAEQRAALLEQRREAMAAMARQQREMTMKLSAMRNGGNAGHQQNGAIGLHGALGAAPTSPSSTVSSMSGPPLPPTRLASTGTNDFSVGSIGGTVIGGTGAPSNIGGAAIGSITGRGSLVGSLGGDAIGGADASGRRSSSIGGDMYAGPPSNSKFAVGNASDKWGSQPANSNSGLLGSGNSFALQNGGIWGGDNAGSCESMPIGSARGSAPGVIGGSTIGARGPMGGSGLGGNPFAGVSNSGSSALASMLGINLPSGSGSLRESTQLWESSTPAPLPIGSSSNRASAGVIGSGSKARSTPIGGYPIGGGGMSTGGGSFQSSNSNDIALLQSLLPGVHITSGNAQQPATPASASGGFGAVGAAGWGSVSDPSQQGGGLNDQQGGGGTWGGAGMQASPVGAPGSMLGQSGTQQNNQSNIW